MKEGAMTESMVDLPGGIAGSDGEAFLRKLIKVFAQRLMDIEMAAVLRGIRRDPVLHFAAL